MLNENKFHTTSKADSKKKATTAAPNRTFHYISSRFQAIKIKFKLHKGKEKREESKHRSESAKSFEIYVSIEGKS
jgi:hypothetical protein